MGRLVSFSINDFIFSLVRTSSSPPFSEKDIDEIKSLKQILSKMVSIAFTLDQMKTQDLRREQALAMLFHDVNNKLTCISGYLHILDEIEFDMKTFNSMKKNFHLLHKVATCYIFPRKRTLIKIPSSETLMTSLKVPAMTLTKLILGTFFKIG